MLMDVTTPHVVAAYSYTVCKKFTFENIEEYIKKLDKRDIISQFDSIFSEIDEKRFRREVLEGGEIYYEVGDNDTWEEGANIVITEYVNGATAFANWIVYQLRREPANEEEKNKIRLEVLGVLFQIYYTLLIFNFYGLRHNDLHLGNIIMNDLGQTETFKYYINPEENDYYEIASSEIPKIFDFDYSYSESSLYSEINTRTTEDGGASSCERMAQCSKFNPKYDLYRFTYHLVQISHRYNTDLAKELVSFGTNIDPNFKKGGVVFFLYDVNDNGDIIDYDYILNKKNIASLPKILNLPIFDVFKKKGSSTSIQPIHLSKKERSEQNIFCVPLQSYTEKYTWKYYEKSDTDSYYL